VEVLYTALSVLAGLAGVAVVGLIGARRTPLTPAEWVRRCWRRFWAGRAFAAGLGMTVAATALACVGEWGAVVVFGPVALAGWVGAVLLGPRG
jgi:hypothetical protein